MYQLKRNVTIPDFKSFCVTTECSGTIQLLCTAIFSLEGIKPFRGVKLRQ